MSTVLALSSGYSIVGLVVLVLDVIAIFNILNSAKSVGFKLGWILAVLLLPVLGMILYFLVGAKS